MSAIFLSNNSARIAIQPQLGAGLSCYDVVKDDHWEPIFRTADPATQHPFHLSNILLVPFSGRVSGGGFTFDGTFFPVERNIETEKYPIHGSAFSSVWTVSERADDHIVLSLSADGPGPFRYDAVMTYRLEGSALVMRLAVTNRANIRLPFGAGFHPWFVRDRQTFLTASAEGVWLEQADHLPERFDPVSKHADMDFNTRRPLPDRWINNWFSGWNRTARIEWPTRGLAVDVDSSEDLDQYVVFSPSSEADFFCFEPVSHPVDAFNLPGGPQAHGMKVLDPSGSLTIATKVKPIRT
ncbi:MAG: aldose 1-epimerase [Rhizobiaceae bacterium]|nr:aldose 1-epimerase [Rhizobiaceae bacterium]